MLRRLLLRSSSSSITAAALHGHRFLSPNPQIQVFTRHFLDLHKIGSKEAIEKEKARISDELSRGYFADISEIRKNGGKQIAMANKTVIPSMAAVKFPDVEVSFSDGRSLRLPVSSEQAVTDASDVGVSLVCLSFRANSQAMAESWTAPFLDAFSTSGKVQVYEVSFIDSWLLSLAPVRKLFLKVMKKSNIPQRHIVYSFGDHYDLRKKLQILNLLTGYIFLLDQLGRVRWQGFGFATQDELSSLLTCTSFLLNEK
ncbi:uncharacterized protein LOC120261176 isoform X1 [Dioscorea cayenensis subsp. rotundata]|uniref:Uncharacterized protein LOC120261176 isoform X1 n=1 Tax=Dioscorea cayennensis subsp. rotundata TaxID=55577 RepID=A0AB40BDY6_DIOCR|nr:uncharacterized protein LOC120261176 isoform X1 [Dioscorea cayenensis subsp. rotundata]